MFTELCQLGLALADDTLKLDDLRRELKTGAESPWNVFVAATLIAERVCTAAARPGQRTPFALASAWDLMQFLRRPPDLLVDEISRISGFRDDIENAWDEPVADSYVGLCTTVHEVWSHVFGPEAGIDAWLLETALSLRPQAVLDYGSGTGHFSLQLAQHGIRVQCIDIDPVKSAFLQFRLERHGIEQISVNTAVDEPVDMALAINVLDHLAHPVEAVHRLARTVSESGYLLIDARFPDDGWHQSEPTEIAECAQRLLEYFLPTGRCPAGPPGPELLRRRSQGVSTAPGVAYRMREGHTVRRGRDEASYTLTGKRFYNLAVGLDAAARQIVTLLDGDHDLNEISARTGVPLYEVVDVADLLQRLGYLIVPDARVAAGASQGGDR